mmetsp:Transcript_28099/g.71859  ORF Transcript_28099/g.71859 Transcript_28099/m.71859 type:complete len:201 (-) Transcript_28099:147-749(-)
MGKTTIAKKVAELLGYYDTKQSTFSKNQVQVMQSYGLPDVTTLHALFFGAPCALVHLRARLCSSELRRRRRVAPGSKSTPVASAIGWSSSLTTASAISISSSASAAARSCSSVAKGSQLGPWVASFSRISRRALASAASWCRSSVHLALRPFFLGGMDTNKAVPTRLTARSRRERDSDAVASRSACTREAPIRVEPRAYS